MELTKDIHPLTDFKRNTSEFLRQLKECGRPLILTVNGRAELVVQDAASYQKLRDLAERMETIEAVRASIASIEHGEGRSVEEVFDALESGLRAKIRK